MCSTESRIKTVMNEISDYGSEFKKEIRSLLSKGVAYDQVVWERDVAISQLNDLGIEFGEKIEKYKCIESDKNDDLKYKTMSIKRAKERHRYFEDGRYHSEIKYQDIEEFFDIVNKSMDDLRSSGAKGIHVQYLNSEYIGIYCAIIIYRI